MFDESKSLVLVNVLLSMRASQRLVIPIRSSVGKKSVCSRVFS